MKRQLQNVTRRHPRQTKNPPNLGGLYLLIQYILYLVTLTHFIVV